MLNFLSDRPGPNHSDLNPFSFFCFSCHFLISAVPLGSRKKQEICKFIVVLVAGKILLRVLQ